MQPVFLDGRLSKPTGMSDVGVYSDYENELRDSRYSPTMYFDGAIEPTTSVSARDVDSSQLGRN
jgi:hypothetical protein